MMHRVKVNYENGVDKNGIRETKIIKGRLIKNCDFFIHIENDDGRELIIGKKYIINIKEL